MRLRRRPPELYVDPPPLPLLELEQQRDAVIATAIRLANEKAGLTEDLAEAEAERDRLQVVVAEVRNVLRTTSYFEGADIPDVIAAVGLLAYRAEADRGRP